MERQALIQAFATSLEAEDYVAIAALVQAHGKAHPSVCRRACDAAKRVVAGGPVYLAEAKTPQPELAQHTFTGKSLRFGTKIGRGYYTVRFVDGPFGGTHLTFSVTKAPGQSKKIILSYLAGPNNETDYTGCAYVTLLEGDRARVTLWRQFRSAKDTRLQAGVRALLEDPYLAMTTYGQESGACGLCGRTLTHPDSIASGIGPVCAQRFSS